ncbi:MAG: bifunctional phosphopantothenoylcysteine decarboxylase/phosphopantothenate--cysteine ligase CoaBC [Alphaproteobacteria bacterium]
MDQQRYIDGKNILLIISGGIAAYKALDLIRRLRERGATVRCILTKGGQQFITPLAVAALAEEKVYTDLWSLTDETEMGHIRLTRMADAVLVAPASANLIAKMAHGIADDLASTTLLACNRSILLAPAMNVEMWRHAATQANIATLRQRGLHIVGPDSGDLACGETGTGRMAEVPDILAALAQMLTLSGPLAGKHAIVTSGPTYEPIDPVRFIGNRSSGKQGHAIATMLAKAGAAVTLVSGPVATAAPPLVKTVPVTTAAEMLAACEQALPADIFIGAAAVADWRVTTPAEQKIKKDHNAPTLHLTPNQDILATLAGHRMRPGLVIGFAAETQDILANATAKLARKGCDWLLANNVDGGKTFGADDNQVTLLRKNQGVIPVIEDWPRQSKEALAAQLVNRIVEFFRSQRT